MIFQVSGFSHVGKLKDANQDSFIAEVAQTPLGDVGLIAVADGMGGLSDGEVASATVMRRLSEWFEERLPMLLETMGSSVEGFEQAVEGQWNGLVQDWNLEILRYGASRSMNLGTTITAFLAFGARFSILHVGDSRAYEISDAGVRQLTEDQTFIKREIDAGRVAPEEAATHPQRNVLLQCIGSSKEVRPQVVHGALRKDAVYMVCSDGFRHELSEEELRSELSPSNAMAFDWEAPSEEELRRLCDARLQIDSPDEAADALEGTVAGVLADLMGLVMSRDERDNITAVLLHAESDFM